MEIRAPVKFRRYRSANGKIAIIAHGGRTRKRNLPGSSRGVGPRRNVAGENQNGDTIISEIFYDKFSPFVFTASAPHYNETIIITVVVVVTARQSAFFPRLTSSVRAQTTTMGAAAHYLHGNGFDIYVLMRTSRTGWYMRVPNARYNKE